MGGGQVLQSKMPHEQTINMSTGIIFPHQLFEENPLLSKCTTFYLVEEWLFFKQFRFGQSCNGSRYERTSSEDIGQRWDSGCQCYPSNWNRN